MRARRSCWRPSLESWRRSKRSAWILVGGSVASSVFGEPRQTVDADLVARLLGRHAAPLVERLAGEFYSDLPSIVTAIETQGCFNLIHFETMR